MKKKTGGQKATFQGDVIRRILAEKDFEQFVEDYNNARYTSHSVAITAQDYAIVKDWKAGMITRELSQKYKMKQSHIDSRIRAVAKKQLWETN